MQVEDKESAHAAKERKVKLFNSSYIDNDISNYYFQQYQQYVESTRKISESRESLNKFCVTMLSLLFVIASWVKEDFGRIAYVATSCIGFLIVVGWLLSLRSYKKMNSVKFEVIGKIEEKLPLNLYDYEWNKLKNSSEKWFNQYLPFSMLEIVVPSAFGILYVILIKTALCG